MAEQSKLMLLEDLTKEQIPDGAIVAIGGVHSHNVPMALVRQLIRIGSKDLTLMGSISAGLPIDILVGAGLVKRVLSPYVGFEMWGLAPKYREAVQNGTIDAPDVCEAFPVYTLRAASNGLLFHPFPEVIHEWDDIPSQTDWYKKVKDPFTGKEVYALPAITPDVALIHVQSATEGGNGVHFGSVVTDRLMAAAAKRTIISCDYLITEEESRQRNHEVTIPSFFVDHVIHVPNGAHPTSSHGLYSYDIKEIKEYLNACKDIETYHAYLKQRLDVTEEEYSKAFARPQRHLKEMQVEGPPTISELVAVLFARDIQDGELGICGAVSDIPMAAMQLAERLYAPHLKWIAGGSGYVNPREYLVPSSTDFHMHARADARLSMDEVIPIEMQNIDFFFAGGLQIDAMGNTNLAGFPSEHGWKFRGPGTVGLTFLPRAGRSYLYTLAHSSRTLVEKVAYVSGPGHQPTGNPYGDGPKLLVTNLCVFMWNGAQMQWQLQSLHDGVSLDQVKEATGFTFIIPDKIELTKPPTAEELSTLRAIDPYGFLRGANE